MSNSEAPYFDLQAGCMSFIKPETPFIEEPMKSYWTSILGTAFDKIEHIQLRKEQKTEMLRNIITYFELHLQQFKPPKSTEILNEIFKTP
jgi:DNA repair protein RecO (recombination protein O)